MNVFFSLIAGLVFGLGLIISGMANPAKVHGFLDVAGAWDPSLALVMLGGILVASIGFLFARKRSQSWLGLPLQMPIYMFFVNMLGAIFLMPALATFILKPRK